MFYRLASKFLDFFRTFYPTFLFRHIATTVRIGAGGVIHNYGIPILSEMELQLVERALLSVDEREQQALTMLEQVDERKVAIRT